jgi:hypothetical protein
MKKNFFFSLPSNVVELLTDTAVSKEWVATIVPLEEPIRLLALVVSLSHFRVNHMEPVTEDVDDDQRKKSEHLPRI